MWLPCMWSKYQKSLQSIQSPLNAALISIMQSRSPHSWLGLDQPFFCGAVRAGTLTRTCAFAEWRFLPGEHHQHPAKPAAGSGQPAAGSQPHGNAHIAASASSTAHHQADPHPRPAARAADAAHAARAAHWRAPLAAGSGLANPLNSGQSTGGNVCDVKGLLQESSFCLNSIYPVSR